MWYESWTPRRILGFYDINQESTRAKVERIKERKQKEERDYKEYLRAQCEDAK